MFDSNKILSDTKVFRFVCNHFYKPSKVLVGKLSQSSKKLVEDLRKK